MKFDGHLTIYKPFYLMSTLHYLDKLRKIHISQKCSMTTFILFSLNFLKLRNFSFYSYQNFQIYVRINKLNFTQNLFSNVMIVVYKLLITIEHNPTLRSVLIRDSHYKYLYLAF